MSNGIISLDEISGNDSETDSDDNNSDDFAELREACEAIGADVENAIERVKSSDGADEESLVELARELANDDEMWDALELYRVFNDQHRIKQNHLLNSDKEFTDWSAAFYGDSSTDKAGTETYNQVQNLSRDNGGNLYYYKALFPEPDAEHFPSETAIVWEERPDEDSHIYVTEEYIDQYGDFTLEIAGKDRPVPPWNGASASSGNGDASGEEGDAIDPREMTNAEIEDLVGDLSLDQLDSLLKVEKQTKDRKGAKNAIRDEIDAREDDDSSDSSDSTESEGKSNAAIAGEIISNTSVEMHPDSLTEMLDNGMTRDEIVDRFA